MPLAEPAEFWRHRQQMANARGPSGLRQQYISEPSNDATSVSSNLSDVSSSDQTRAQPSGGSAGQVTSSTHGTSNASGATEATNTSRKDVSTTATAATSNGGEMNALSRLFAVEEALTNKLRRLEAKVTRLFKIVKADEEEGEPSFSTTGFESVPRVKTTIPGLPSDETSSTTPRWMPLAIRKLEPYKCKSLQTQALPIEDLATTFTLEFLTDFLGGDEFSPGFYFPATNQSRHRGLKIASKTYYVLDALTDPFVPLKPAEHGAKLVVVFNDLDDPKNHYEDAPLFVALPGQPKDHKRYTYLGSYTQFRWSDRLDRDRILEVVPESVRQHWADKLCDSSRPEWMEKALMEHFWPKPEYEGAIHQGLEVEHTNDIVHSGVTSNMNKAIDDAKDFAEDLTEWYRQGRIKLGLLKRENICEAFEKADADSEPGLRFWWEYLQCTGFDRNFYYMLSTKMKEKDGVLAEAGW